MQEENWVCQKLQEKKKKKRCRKELFVALCSGFYLESLFIKMFSLAHTLLLLLGRSPQLPPSLLLFELKLFPWLNNE